MFVLVDNFNVILVCVFEQLDIVCQNFTTRTRDQGVFNADVCLLAISDDSSWLATVERRPIDDKYVVDDVLKFWTFNEKLQM